jgi:parvulin-like peptidyl-prolyl isomerase
MSKPVQISVREFIQQLKLSCQVPAVLEGILKRQIIASAAQQNQIQVELAELQQMADQLRSQNTLWSAEETWVWLQTHRLTLDDFEEIAREQVLSAKLAQHLFASAVEPFFAEHQLDYVQVILYEVVLDDPDLALELFYSLQEQETSFFDIAHRYIPDPELRRKGGYSGSLRRGDLRPEISAAVFATQPPQILRPIVINRQSHLVWVEEIVQPQLDEALRSQILQELFSKWLQRQVAELMKLVEVTL